MPPPPITASIACLTIAIAMAGPVIAQDDDTGPTVASARPPCAMHLLTRPGEIAFGRFVPVADDGRNFLTCPPQPIFTTVQEGEYTCAPTHNRCPTIGDLEDVQVAINLSFHFQNVSDTEAIGLPLSFPEMAGGTQQGLVTDVVVDSLGAVIAYEIQIPDPNGGELPQRLSLSADALTPWQTEEGVTFVLNGDEGLLERAPASPGSSPFDSTTLQALGLDGEFDPTTLRTWQNFDGNIQAEALILNEQLRGG